MTRLTTSIFSSLLFAVLYMASAIAAAQTKIETEIIRSELVIGNKEAGVFQPIEYDLEDGEEFFSPLSHEEVVAQREIPAVIGTKFGVRFSFSGLGANNPKEVTMLYLTPGVIDDNGERHDKYEVKKMLEPNSKGQIMAFAITEPYEKVPGEWLFMLFYKDKLLFKETFNLVAAD